VRGFLGRESAEENVRRLTATDTGADYALEPLQRAFLLSRAETIYGGRSHIIGERVPGLPKEPRPGSRAHDRATVAAGLASYGGDVIRKGCLPWVLPAAVRWRS
jgi:hypothetical protein